MITPYLTATLIFKNSVHRFPGESYAGHVDDWLVWADIPPRPLYVRLALVYLHLGTLPETIDYFIQAASFQDSAWNVFNYKIMPYLY